MKKLLLIPVLIVALLPVKAQESFGGLMFSARLDTTHQEGNLLVPSSGNGVGGFSYHDDTLWFDITANGLTGPITTAHIHSESSGSVEYSLNSFIDRNKLKGYLSGISFGDGQLKDFLDGEYYVNIHTSANPDGEIAGRIIPETDDNYSAMLDMAQAGNPDPPDQTPSGLGSFNLSQDKTELEVNLLVNDLTAAITNAHLHFGAPGISGPVIVPLTPFKVGNSYQGVFDLTTLTNPSAFLDSLIQGKVYVNVHTSNFPGGEIRGQLTKNHPLSFDTWMDASQETGGVDPGTPVDARGLCNFTVNSQINMMWVSIQADQLSGVITGAHFHSGKEGESGPVEVSLTGFVEGNIITAVLTPDSPEFTGDLDFDSFVKKVISDDIYVNIHTALNPSGEVRGQPASLTREGVIYSLCADQETGAVTGGDIAQGSGFVSLDRNYSNLHYGMAVSNLSSPLVADHFHNALPGVNGSVIYTLPTDSILMGFWNDASFTSDIADKFESGEIYSNFHTGTNPAGEVRGQVSMNSLCMSTIGIADIDPQGDNLVKIYPNPLKTVGTITYTLSQPGEATIRVFNLLGKEVSTLAQGNKLQGTFTQQVNVSSLPDGVYIYNLVVNGNSVKTGKIIVNR